MPSQDHRVNDDSHWQFSIPNYGNPVRELGWILGGVWLNPLNKKMKRSSTLSRSRNVGNPISEELISKNFPGWDAP